MKRLLLILCVVFALAACSDTEKQLLERATELCNYIPDHQLLETSREYMTDDFYNVLDTMFYRLPDYEECAHEWLYYFVTGNGGTIADYEVVSVEKTDPTHAIATVNVRQKWEDGSFADPDDLETHLLYMEKVNGKWLMSDFDEHKQDCIRNIEISKRELAKREAISNYMISEIGVHYVQGEYCVPVLMIVDEDDENNKIWLDSWIFWYNLSGDTLKTVSGGNHSGCITLKRDNGELTVVSFEQTVDGAGYEASAKRIFGDKYEIFENIHANHNVSESARQMHLREYIRQHSLDVNYYQDYGWQAVKL